MFDTEVEHFLCFFDAADDRQENLCFPLVLLL
jgi:hypothetical protein